MPPPFLMGGHSITTVRRSHTSVPYENGFRSLSFEKKNYCIGFIFYTQVYNNKIQLKFCLKNGFHSLTFENITALDSHFINTDKIKYRSRSILGKINQVWGDQ